MNITEKSFFNLFNYSLDFEVPELPAEFWYLQVLEIVIQLDGEHYFVFEYPFYSYNDVVNNKIGECTWVPPYCASKVNIGNRRIRKVGQIIKEYNSFETENKSVLKELLEHKLYTMGVGSYELRDNGTILEYKRSFREPSKWKCYFVKRFGLVNLDKFDLYNIVDPECQKGYAYLNIEKHTQLLSKDASTLTFYFKGKPLASNVAYLFLDNSVQNLVHNLNPISRDFLTYKENGVLFSFDLVSFGKNQDIIKNTFKTLDRYGSDISDDFEFLLNRIFGTLLNTNNYNQYRLMGDGFIAASPIRHNLLSKSEKDQVVISDQIAKTLTLVASIFSQLQMAAPNYPNQISCRCSILFDEYYYGKIGGLICDKAEFAGKSILKLQRLQGLIDLWFTEFNTKTVGCFFLVVEYNSYICYQDVFRSFNFDETSKYSGRYKEFEGNVIILTKKLY